MGAPTAVPRRTGIQTGVRPRSTSAATVTQPSARVGVPDLEASVPRATLLLAASMALVWAVTQLQATLATITVEVLTGQAALAGLGPAIFLVATALVTRPARRLMERFGGVAVLSAGFVLVSLGSAIVFASVSAGSVAGLCLGLAALGGGFGAVNLARVAAADMYAPPQRASGVGRVILGAAIGGGAAVLVFAPLLQGREAVATSLAAPWMVAAALAAVGAGLVWAMRVDPVEIGQRRAHGPDHGQPDEPAEASEAEARPAALSALQGRSGTRAGLLGTVTAQAVLTSVIVLVGLDMHHRGQDLGAISIVIGGLFVGMFILTIVVGRFVGTTGHRRALTIGLLALAGGCAGLLLGSSQWSLLPAAFLAGSGWSVAYRAGMALIGSATAPPERANALARAELGGLLCAAPAAIAAAVLLAAGGLLPAVVLAVAAAVAPAIFIERERPALATV